jgi:hypothetical protein
VITYTVTAENGTTKTFTVNVVVAPYVSPSKDILTFGFVSPNVSGVINGTTINVTVPNGTNVKNLVAKFTSSPKSEVKVAGVLQVSSLTTNDFTSPVVYTVIAEDGTSKSYSIVVTISKSNLSSDKELLSFGIFDPLISGTIKDSNVVINALKGTNLTSLKIIFDVSPGATLTMSGTTLVSQVSRRDFSNPVTVTVVAADGSKKNYVITVKVPKSSDKIFTFFKMINPYAEGKIDTVAKTITISMPYGTGSNALTPVFGVSTKATVMIGNTTQTSGVGVLDFTNPIVYTVIAEDGSSVNYTVTVKVASVGIEENEVLALKMYPNPSNGLFNIETDELNYSVEVMDALGKRIVFEEYNHSNATIQPIDLNAFGSGIYYATIRTTKSTKLVKLEVIQ